MEFERGEIRQIERQREREKEKEKKIEKNEETKNAKEFLRLIGYKNFYHKLQRINMIYQTQLIHQTQFMQTFYRRYSPTEINNDKRSTIVADTIPNVESGVVLVDILPPDTSNYTMNKSTAEDDDQFNRIMVSHLSKEGSVKGSMGCPPGQCKVEERYTIVGHEQAEAHGQGDEGINIEIEGKKTRSIAREFEVGGFSDNTEDNTEDSDDEDVDDIESYRLADRSAGSREYLKSTLMTHAIWRDRLFWEQALWQCTMEQVISKEIDGFLHRVCCHHRYPEGLTSR